MEKELGTAVLAEVDFYDAFVDPPLQTARVMNLVSDFIPAGAWLNQLKFVRNKKEIQLTLMGLSESVGKSSKLIEIQNFANKLKDQMEQLLEPLSPVDAGVKKHLKVAVTTSSQKADSVKGELTQFTVTFQTEKFESPK